MKLLLTIIKGVHKPAVGNSLQRCVSTRPFSAPDEALIVGSSRELVQKLGSQVQVRTGFITEEEEQALLRELDPGLKKKRYEFDHWDDVSLKKLTAWFPSIVSRTSREGRLLLLMLRSSYVGLVIPTNAS